MRVHTYPHDGSGTFGTMWRKIVLIVFLAVDKPIELHKSHIDQLTATFGASEMVRAPALVQGNDERTSAITAQYPVFRI